MTSILGRIKNGDLHTTTFYDSDWKADESRADVDDQQVSNIERYQLYSQIRSLIAEKLVSGDCDNAPVNPHYTNLKLTESGKEFLRFNELTFDDIDNSSGKDSLKNWLIRPLILLCIGSLILFIAKEIWDVQKPKELGTSTQPQQETLDKTAPSKPPTNKNLIKIDKHPT